MSDSALILSSHLSYPARERQDVTIFFEILFPKQAVVISGVMAEELYHILSLV